MLSDVVTANEDRYRLQELVRRGDGFEVFRALEASTESPCFYHQFELPEELSENQRYLTLGVLRNYARIMAPRAPRVADSWTTDLHLVAVEFAWEAPAMDRFTRNPLQHGSPIERREILKRCIGHVSSLHAANLVHGKLEPGCFGIDERRKIYLLDTGLDRAVVRAMRGTENQIALSTNLQSRDLADLTYHLLSMMLGKDLLDMPGEDCWDEIDFKEVRNRLEAEFRSAKMIDYLLMCLSGYGMDQARFESATAALSYWVTHKLGEEFR